MSMNLPSFFFIFEVAPFPAGPAAHKSTVLQEFFDVLFTTAVLLLTDKKQTEYMRHRQPQET